MVSPLRLSFYPNDSNQIFMIIGLLIDITFIIDIGINFLTAFERKDGEMEYRLKNIAVNYILGFFWIDLISSFPFHLIG